MSRCLILVAVVLPLLAIAVTSAPAASFNCRLAKTATERTICTTPSLSAKDSEMGVSFRRLLSLVGHSGQRDQFIAD